MKNFIQLRGVRCVAAIVAAVAIGAGAIGAMSLIERMGQPEQAAVQPVERPSGQDLLELRREHGREEGDRLYSEQMAAWAASRKAEEQG